MSLTVVRRIEHPATGMGPFESWDYLREHPESAAGLDNMSTWYETLRHSLKLVPAPREDSPALARLFPPGCCSRAEGSWRAYHFAFLPGSDAYRACFDTRRLRAAGFILKELTLPDGCLVQGKHQVVYRKADVLEEKLVDIW